MRRLAVSVALSAAALASAACEPVETGPSSSPAPTSRATIAVPSPTAEPTRSLQEPAATPSGQPGTPTVLPTVRVTPSKIMGFLVVEDNEPCVRENESALSIVRGEQVAAICRQESTGELLWHVPELAPIPPAGLLSNSEAWRRYGLYGRPVGEPCEKLGAESRVWYGGGMMVLRCWLDVDSNNWVWRPATLEVTEGIREMERTGVTPSPTFTPAPSPAPPAPPPPVTAPPTASPLDVERDDLG